MRFRDWLARLFWPSDPAPSPRPIPQPVPSPLPLNDDVSTRVVELMNATRAGSRLTPLAIEPRLQRAARSHSQQEAARGRMAHSGIGDGTPEDRVNAAGYPWAALAENVAWGQPDEPAVMNEWINSPPHYQNIMGPYIHVGVGMSIGADGRPYWTATFGRPQYAR